MRYLIIILVLFGLFPISLFAYTVDDFVITVDTSLPGPGSNNNQFRLPTTGSGYNFTVDWGDASTTVHVGTPGTVTHNYAVPGVYEIVITPNVVGGFPRIHFNNSNDRREKILTVEQWGTNQWSSMAFAFSGCINLEIVATDAPNLSAVADFRNMFSNTTNLTGDLSVWNVSNATNTSGMFAASGFNEPINSWDVSNVQNMSNMFLASAFNQPLDSWDVSNVQNMNSMFYLASAFNQPLNSWDVSSVTTLESMFQQAAAFNQPLDNWNVSNVTTAYRMFINNTAFNGLLANWDLSGAIIGSMFEGATAFNQDISSWNVSGVTNMTSLFQGATSFNQPLDSWDVSSVTSMQGLFFGATNFNQPLSSWDVSNVTDMIAMFSGTAFDQDISDWDVSNVSAFSTSGLDFLLNTPISIQNYTNILNDWSQLTLQNGLTLGVVGVSADPTPYLTSAQAARDIITGTYGWVITDGGPVTAYNLTYSPGLNATLLGEGSQTVIAGEDGAAVTVVPDEGYVFVKWSDESTANPRIDLAVVSDLSLTAIIEAEQSGESDGTKIGVRNERLEAIVDASTFVTTPVTTTISSFISSVKNLVSYLTQYEDEIDNLSPEESERLIIALREVLHYLISLVPGV